MSKTESLAARMRQQYEDLSELYDDAKLNENGPVMEKYSKAMSGLAKQIKEHEQYERTTVPHTDAVTFAREVAYAVHDVLKEKIPDGDERAEVVNKIRTHFKRLIEGLKTDDDSN